MNKEFIPYKQSLFLKELGFNEECFGYYTGDKMHLVIRPAMSRTNIPESYVVTAPLYQQAFRWFREKYGIKTYVYEVLENRFVFITYTNQLDYKMSSTYHETYEEAQLECLIKLIELCKKH